MKIIKNFHFVLIFCCLSACSTRSAQPPTPTRTEVLLPPTVNSSATEPPPEPTVESIPSIAQYGLAGRLVLIKFGQGGNRLVELNLHSGEIKTLFQAPENSWLAAAVVSPDSRQILLAYAPPPPGNEPQYGYSDLYLLPYDGASQPQPFLTRKDPDESFFFPTWAPDGQSVFFTHLRRIDPNSEIPAYQNDVETATLNGETKTIIEHALWPAISPDGSKLSFLYADPTTFGNDLYIANPDGTSQVPVFQPGTYPPIDAHTFTVDGNQLIFSMVNPQPAPASFWWDKFFGVEVASAHSVPSDWYIAPIAGGNPQRLTNLDEVNLNGDLSPDGTQLAFNGAYGLYFMNIDGSGLIQLTSDVLIGTVDWIP